MITIHELNSKISLLGLPLAYQQFENTELVPAPNVPFLTWNEEDSQNYGADNKVWKKIQNYQIELYTAEREFTLESQLEEIFTDNDVFFESDCNWIPTERMQQTIYYITLIKQ